MFLLRVFYVLLVLVAILFIIIYIIVYLKIQVKQNKSFFFA